MASKKYEIPGKIFNIQRFSVQDGPGVRTVIFLKGCPLSCKWCCNPEAQNEKLDILMQKQKCIGCEKCFNLCSKKAITKGRDWWVLDKQLCDLCGECAKNCFSGAISIVGEQVSADEVVARVLKDKLIYINSGGGVTLSGGEPTCQFKFSRAILKRCKEENLHTAIETCGYAPWKVFEGLLDYVDLFLYDIKLIDDIKHERFTGVGNSRIIENFKMLTRSGKNVIARCPLIPRVNTDADDIKRLQSLLKESGISEVHLLPYHKLGINKYVSLGIPYQMEDTPFFPDEDLERISEMLATPGVKLVVYKH